MLTEILSVALPAPKPASSHILNQSIVGIGSPAGDSGTTDRGAVGTAAPVESEPLVHHTTQLPRIDDTPADTGLELTPWRRWLSLAEALIGHSLEDDNGAYPAFEKGVLPEAYVGAQVEPCETCKTPGAPAHEPSRLCHYRPRIVAHCTCRACF